MKTGVVLLAIGLLALGVVFFGSRAPESPAAPSQQPITGNRVFMLLPDGRVEFSDAWAHHVFRWDGRRWIEIDARETRIAPR